MGKQLTFKKLGKIITGYCGMSEVVARYGSLVFEIIGVSAVHYGDIDRDGTIKY
jgi:hypothetical protein